MNSLNNLPPFVQPSPLNFQSEKQSIDNIAAHVEPQEILTKGEPLGAGLVGKGFKLRIEGQDYVAKNFGNPDSALGKADCVSVSDFQMMALKQASMHNALALAGLPISVAAIIAKDSSWVVMKMAEGVPKKDLTEAEQSQAEAIGYKLRDHIEPLLQAPLEALRAKYPDTIVFETMTGDTEVDNMRFAREPDGLKLLQFYDPGF